MNKSLLIGLLLLMGLSYGFCQKHTWRVELALNDRLTLPFFLEEVQTFENSQYYIHNGQESIPLICTKQKTDSLKLSFPEMDSYLVILKESIDVFRGYWKNNIKNQTIPLVGILNDTIRFPQINNGPPSTIANKFRVIFSQEEEPWPAVGLFEQTQNRLTGTFLTETGDFRFLSGNIYGNELFLSCFDGSHAFVFTATVNQDSLRGRFYSGSRYQTDWIGIADEKASIKDPNKLTYIVDSVYNLNEIKLRTLCGLKTKLGLFKNSLTLIQITGSWCPNCLDETNYYKELFEKYNKMGLNIISIGFEYGRDSKQQRKKLKRFSKRAKLPYTVLLGGKASKKDASNLFPMLNSISSFPTTLFVNKSGEIIHIHTGFNGPGTGVYFEDYKKEIESLIMNVIN